MSVQLPPVVANYIRAKNSHDTEAMLACFAEDAIVHDDGDDFEPHGTAAIRQWIEETTAKYRVTLEVISAEARNDEFVVTTLVSGDFAGSPIEFHYHFVLRDDKIAELSVHV